MSMRVNAETLASGQTFADRADPYLEAARLRDELAQTRQMLADAQRLTKTGSWIIDPIGGGASGSVEGYRILGLPGKTPSAHFMECLSNVHPDALPGVLEGFQQSVATGEPRPLHYRIVAGDGSTTDIETVAQPVCDETGRVVSVVGTVMDVTERNRVQEALRASEKLARGQLGALTRTLDALVQEASPDRLMEVVLRTIARQFDASTITVWLTGEGSGSPGFRFQFINDRLFSVADAAHPAARMSPEAQDNPVWRKILATKRPEICEDVRSSTEVPFREYNLSLGTVTILVVPMLIAFRPRVLEGNDLSTALREMVTGMTDGTSVNSEFAQGGVSRQLPPEWDEHLLRIGQETLTNAIRHGHAQRIVLELDFSDDAVQLRLTDDGRGFDANSAFDGLRLAGIRARVSSMGGQLSISSAAGSGTTISVSVPQRTATAP